MLNQPSIQKFFFLFFLGRLVFKVYTMSKCLTLTPISYTEGITVLSAILTLIYSVSKKQYAVGIKFNSIHLFSCDASVTVTLFAPNSLESALTSSIFTHFQVSSQTAVYAGRFGAGILINYFGDRDGNTCRIRWHSRPTNVNLFVEYYRSKSTTIQLTNWIRCPLASLGTAWRRA